MNTDLNNLIFYSLLLFFKSLINFCFKTTIYYDISTENNQTTYLITSKDLHLFNIKDA